MPTFVCGLSVNHPELLQYEGFISLIAVSHLHNFVYIVFLQHRVLSFYSAAEYVHMR
jgi:hypothetical protein